MRYLNALKRISAGGRLVDFFDAAAIAQTTLEALEARAVSVALAAQARSDAQRYSRNLGLDGYEELLKPPSAMPGSA